MSSQVTVGTSTTTWATPRSGALTLKLSMVTARELSTSASIWSSSRSMRSIFSRICCRAASEHRAARSEPTKPCDSAEICTK
ncbi:unnamed protein product, partial [Ixodes persulcatus]